MNDFTLPMKKREKIAGWIYMPVHSVLMGQLILPLVYLLLAENGIILDDVQINVIYYGISLAFVLLFMMSYLRESFIMKKKAGTLITVAKGFAATIVLNYIATFILLFFTSQLTNPNSEAVNDAVTMNVYSMIAVTVIMAPIVEEVLFRGVVFGTIRTKSRILAYAVSILIFSIYHLWSSVAIYHDWTILIYIIQYIPAGITLAWSYEKTGSVWTSIFLHMAINAVSVSAMLG